MDSELARAIELAPLSPLSKIHLFLQQCELSLDEGFSGRWLPCAENKSEGQTSKQSEEKVKRLVSLQLRGKFYHVEDGLMTLLRNCLESDSKNLCSIISRHVDHFQSTKSEDSGWGCGWRNIQMMSSHLITERKDAREVLFGGIGFVHGPMDKFVTKFHKTTSQTNGSEYSGAEHSESHIRPPYCFQEQDSISDTRKSYNSTGDHHSLVDWVWNYFASENSCSSGCVSVSKKTPLYFQHDGHSRTIIGIQIHKSTEMMSREYSLLVLDPSQRTADLESSLKRNVGWQRLLKRGVHTLKKPQYQLCYVDPGIAFGKELEQLKTIDSILVEI
ncbi:Zinc finger with UFM1-specific peptidase domain protein [Nymphaea thermarum]|nr:Zinc finger with UFM1-specific peptidase domain protein [Nymphaea thermarum]